MDRTFDEGLVQVMGCTGFHRFVPEGSAMTAVDGATKQFPAVNTPGREARLSLGLAPDA
jgi:hypothetical protein